MPHGGNQRNFGRRHRAGDDFLVKAPQILNRTPAARHDDQIGTGQRATGRQRVEPTDRIGDLGRTVLPLNRDGPDQNLAREAVAQPVQNIADHRARGRGHNADDFGQIGDRTFARLIKQTLRRQRLFALFQHGHQRALARDDHLFDVHVVFRLGPERGQFAGDDHLHPLFGEDGEARGLPFPRRAGQHVIVVLDVVIKMPRARTEHAPHLTAHPNPVKRALNRAFDRARDLGNGEFWRVCPRDRVINQVGHLCSLVMARLSA